MVYTAEAYSYRPKRRHLVICEFIEACIEENTLLDEDGGCRIYFLIEMLIWDAEFAP